MILAPFVIDRAVDLACHEGYAEGSANYGIEMAFPGTERQDFEREVLFALADLDAGRVDQYCEAQELVAKLGYVLPSGLQ